MQSDNSTCESCAAPLPESAVICVQCGFDRRTGKTLASQKQFAAEDDAGQPTELEEILQHVQDRLRLLSRWLLSPIGITASAAVVIVLLIPIVFYITFVVAVICFTVGTGWILLIAYDESVTCFILMLLAPPYGVYYVLTRWENATPFRLYFGSILAFLGLCLAAIIRSALFGW